MTSSGWNAHCKTGFLLTTVLFPLCYTRLDLCIPYKQSSPTPPWLAGASPLAVNHLQGRSTHLQVVEQVYSWHQPSPVVRQKVSNLHPGAIPALCRYQ